jgi:adenylate cyclase
MRLLAQVDGQVVASYELHEGAELMLGASPKADCCFSGERFMSRLHVSLRLASPKLEVRRNPKAKNPVLYKGVNADEFLMNAGEYFVIGETKFKLDGAGMGAAVPAMAKTPIALAPGEQAPSYQFTVNVDELRMRGGAGDRMRLLDLMELPDVLRSRPRSDFFVYACGLLRMAAAAKWVRVLRMNEGELEVLAEDATFDREEDHPASLSLVQAAIDEAPKPVTYCWSHQLDAGFEATAHEGVDWAVSCAMPVPGEPPVIFYLAGDAGGSVGQGGFASQSGARTVLRDTARLVGLVSDMIGRTMSMQKLESWQSRLGHFFSGKLVDKILETDVQEDLAPKVTEATVMFFDIRGFSKLTESQKNLNQVLEYESQLRRVLTAMTQCVFDHEGVVIRYMGDGILSCWNVPYPFEKHVDAACQAALDMVEQMREVTDGWGCGIGLAVGDIVAGSLGSEQVYAYDVLGAEVNRASRVEGITKAVGVPILVTGDVAERITSDKLLARKVARFLPVGMETELDLFTLDARPDDPEVLESIQRRFDQYAKGLADYEKGDWEAACDALRSIVSEDAPARYLYTLASDRRPPVTFRGLVEMTVK